MALWRWWLLSVLIALLPNPGLAQITPDDTLGAERSQVTPNVRIRGRASDRIDGGARRGANLFHSFREFNVQAGRAAYFSNPDGVRNILGRVTGGSPSRILGTLGVDGAANLFLLNPSGILFGPAARLDVSGSFVGTTATAFQFGEQGFFSAATPETPGLLTINPSAFLFNQIPPGNIVNRARGIGLRVANGQSLLLLGGNVLIDGGRLNAFGGRVEIGAVAGAGAIGLNPDQSLSFGSGTSRGDVGLTNGAQVGVLAGSGGDIAITGRTIALLADSLLIAGINSGLGAPDSQAGDVVLNADTIRFDRSKVFNSVFAEGVGNSGNIRVAAASLSLTNGSQLDTSLFGQGNAGDIVINARDTVALDGSRRVSAGELRSVLFAEVVEGASGNSGNIFVDTGSLFVTNGAAVVNRNLGRGNAGNIVIQARDRVVFKGASQAGASSAASSLIGPDVTGRGGDIAIVSGSLTVANAAFLATGTFGAGDAGNITLRARDRIRLDNARVNASTFGAGDAGNVSIAAGGSVVFDNANVLNIVGQGAEGTGGNVQLSADTLTLTNRATLNASTFGQGRSGNVLVNADDRVRLNNSGIFSLVGENALGNGGTIVITTGSLTASNQAQIAADVDGRGNAGNILITARDRVEADTVSLFRSGIGRTGAGRGGNIVIHTGRLSFRSGANLITTVSGRGMAGDIMINARDHVLFTGTAADGNPSTAAYSNINETGVGRGGNIEITAGSLDVLNGAQLGSGTKGRGNSGNVRIRVRDRVLFQGNSADGEFSGSALSTVGENAVGSGGNVEITAGSLEVRDGAQLLSTSQGRGDAGDIMIRARDRVIFDGESPNRRRSSTANSRLDGNAIGEGGNIRITTGSLFITNEAQLNASTLGRGDAGAVVVEARDRVVLDGGYIFSAVGSRTTTGQGGTIRVAADSLVLNNGGLLSTTTNGRGDAGDVTIQAQSRIAIAGRGPGGSFRSGVSSAVLADAQGDGGDVRITTDSLLLTDEAALDASTAGRGNGGRITIDTTTLDLSDRALISAQSLSRGTAGDITITAREQVQLTDSDIATVAPLSSGGDIQINPTGNRGQITLRENSDIRTNSAIAGGNITLRAASILAFADSDIFAFAGQQGGNITLDTPAFFGEDYRPDDINPNTLDSNDRVDINASGTVSAGAIQLPDTSFIQNSLSELPTVGLDADSLIANSCIARDSQDGTFLVTGAGGLPPRPGVLRLSPYPTAAVRTEPEQIDRSWQVSEPIVEPQGVYRLPDGQLVMSRECQPKQD